MRSHWGVSVLYASAAVSEKDASGAREAADKFNQTFRPTFLSSLTPIDSGRSSGLTLGGVQDKIQNSPPQKKKKKIIADWRVDTDKYAG